MSERTKNIGTEIALTVGAIAGVLCVVFAIVGVSFGLSPLVFRSESMSPAINVGDVAIARSVPASDVSVGDIVSVSREDGTRITHRVVSIDSRVGNSTTMTLQGDANNVVDSAPYTVTSVDRVVFDIPKLGYVLSWFANPFSWAVATLLTLGLLWAAFRPDKRFRRTHRGRHAAPAPSDRSRYAAVGVQVAVVVMVVATAVAGFARTHGTLAALTDSATATGSVSAGRPEVPTALTCNNVSGGVLVTNALLSWPNPANHRAYDYQLVFTPTGGTGSTTVVPATTADPATLTVNRSYVTGVLGLALLGTYSVELRSKVGNFLSTGKLTISLNVLLGSVTCGAASGAASQSAQANARSAPAQTTTSTPSTSAAPSSSTPAPTTSSPTTSAPSSTAPTETTTATPAPAASSVSDTSSPGGTYVASSSDGTVVIRDKAAGAEQYRADLRATKLEWVDDSTLRVTGADGSTTTVSRADGAWTASGSTPATAPAG
ncbi:signal peptidase I [Williamsia maris]|uniref:Signal peptidase I n=1 Tax=Williamsia maris TaxID=72806 RepID=A0ABT1HA23_9NOCA|nr:signal peptidase I [Williamsia maris]MCP2174812.1 signal peptidase I [Williamsia maris]